MQPRQRDSEAHRRLRPLSARAMAALQQKEQSTITAGQQTQQHKMYTGCGSRSSPTGRGRGANRHTRPSCWPGSRCPRPSCSRSGRSSGSHQPACTAPRPFSAQTTQTHGQRFLHLLPSPAHQTGHTSVGQRPQCRTANSASPNASSTRRACCAAEITTLCVVPSLLVQRPTGVPFPLPVWDTGLTQSPAWATPHDCVTERQPA